PQTTLARLLAGHGRRGTGAVPLVRWRVGARRGQRRPDPARPHHSRPEFGRPPGSTPPAQPLTREVLGVHLTGVREALTKGNREPTGVLVAPDDVAEISLGVRRQPSCKSPLTVCRGRFTHCGCPSQPAPTPTANPGPPRPRERSLR